MIELDWRILAAIALFVLWLWSRLIRAWGGFRRSLVARRRGARAVKGERDAEALLEDEGYEILERQLRTLWEIECDGEYAAFELRADLLVSKDGRQYIAEVKTGERAPDLRNAATRRQLLEYALAYQSPTILLVDVEGEEIHEVIFPLPSSDVATLPSDSEDDALPTDAGGVALSPETKTALLLHESTGQLSA